MIMKTPTLAIDLTTMKVERLFSDELAIKSKPQLFRLAPDPLIPSMLSLPFWGVNTSLLVNVTPSVSVRMGGKSAYFFIAMEVTWLHHLLLTTEWEFGLTCGSYIFMDGACAL
jgi:hypothetical protein